ncbi:MAG: hypothetical protein JWO70_970 [Betaproteobacteria bacterium]|nr:hypothetical protein [Betaproteobacteria bacterium]
MTPRIAAAILGVVFVTAAAHAQTVFVTPANLEDPAEPTGMPDYCAERDVNCVLDNGPPRRAVVGASIGTTPGTTPMAPGAADGATAGSSARISPAPAK